MKKLLLIMGDLATGKSTFANMLSRRYSTVLFCKDPIKETLSNTFGFSNRAENLKLSYATADLLYQIFRGFAKVDQDLILESNFRLHELELLHLIAAEHDYQVLTVSLRADLEILHARFLHRLYHENRHPVHACGGFEEFDTFKAYILRQRDLKIPGRYLELRADNFDYQRDEGVLAELDKFMCCFSATDVVK